MTCWQRFCTPVSWRTSLLAYFALTSFDVLLWASLFCRTQAFLAVFSLHLSVEGWNMSRILFNDSKSLQPFWTGVSIVLIVLISALPLGAATGVFGVTFLLTDSMSLIFGLYLFLVQPLVTNNANANVSADKWSRIGLSFALHGVCTMFLSPLLLSQQVLAGNIMYPSLIMTTVYLSQIVLVRDWLRAGSFGEDTGQMLCVPPVQKLTVLAVWAVYVAMVAMVFVYMITFSSACSQTSSSNQVILLLMQALLPVTGLLGLLLPSWWFKT